MAGQAELAEQELTACCKSGINTSQENLKNERAVGPMLISRGKAQFTYFPCGLVGLTVAAQLPLVDAEPDQHPNDQLQKTSETAWDLTEAIHRFWESLAKGTETAQQLSDRCRFLHTGVVKRVPGADYPESEDAQPSIKEESMAD